MFDFLFEQQALLEFLNTSLRLSIPLIFASVGGIIAEKSGVFNISLEGCILGGAFGAAVGTYVTASPVFGLILGVTVAMMVGVVLAGLAVGLAINQLVAGIAINILMLGLTSYLARLILGADATSTLPGFYPVAIPLLSSIPIIGELLFKQDAITYGMYAVIPFTWWVFYKTPWGLSLRAIGDYPVAADSAGINVTKVRVCATLTSCAMAGLGGCYLVLSQVFVFTEHMSAGKGFIALAALILGGWNPARAVLAALLFGAMDALQLRLQFNSPEVPYQIFSMLPYLASLLALIFLAKRIQPPKAIGIKYRRGGK